MTTFDIFLIWTLRLCVVLGILAVIGIVIWIRWEAKMHRAAAGTPSEGPPPIPPVVSPTGGAPGEGGDGTSSIPPLELSEEKKGRKIFWNWVVISYTLFLILLTMLSAITGFPLSWYAALGVFTAGVTFLASYTIGSIQTVTQDEKGSKYFLKRYIHAVVSGPVFVPRWLCSIRTATIKTIIIRIGKPDPKRDDAGKIIEEAKLKYPKEAVVIFYDEPLRVTFADHATADWNSPTEKSRFGKDDPLGQRQTTDPYFVIIGRIENHRRFLETMGTAEEAAFNIDRVARPALQEYCSRRTVAYTLYNLPEAAEKILDTLEELVRDPKPRSPELRKRLREDPQEWARRTWGFDIQEVRVEALGLPSRVNHAIADARQAQYVKEKTITAAEATRKKLEEEGAGTASARKALGEAEAVALEAKRVVLAKEGGELMAMLEAAPKVAENTDLMVVPSDNLYGALAGGAEMWRRLSSRRGGQPPQQRQEPAQTGGTPPHQTQEEK